MVSIKIKGNKNETILDYIENQSQTFHDLPFHEIDALILAQITYLNIKKKVAFDTLPWRPISSLFEDEDIDALTDGTFYPHLFRRFVPALQASPRYRDIEINFHIEKFDPLTEEQFSATTFKLPTGEIALAFRGTDKKIIGWKEDFNMTYLSPVPSQLSAVHYLENIGAQTTGPLYIMGHSKGGNLAVYSSTFCNPQLIQRIQTIYNFDGPGFTPPVLEEVQHQHIKEKIMTFIPEQSIVGTFLETTGKVHSVKSQNISFLQHNGFSWMIWDGHFLLSQFPKEPKRLDASVNKWILDLDMEQRKLFVDTIFSIIIASKAETFDELGKHAIKERESIKNTFKNIDPETGACVKAMLINLIKITLNY